MPVTSNAYRKNPETITCANCGGKSTSNERVEIEPGRRAGTCLECFPTVQFWGQICRRCDALLCYHGGALKNECPLAVTEAQPLDLVRPALPAPLRALEAPLDVEVIDDH